MRNSFGCVILCVIFCLVSVPVIAQGSDDSQDTLKERVHQAAVTSTLDFDGSKPWHLIMSFELPAATEKADRSGTVEEWWAGPDLHKTSYKGQFGTWVTIKNGDGVFRTSAGTEPPPLAEMLLDGIVRPFPPTRADMELAYSLEEKALGPVALDCITVMPQPGSKIPAPGQIYCLDKDRNSLRVVYMHGSEIISRTKMQTFEAKIVPSEQSIGFKGVIAAKSHLLTLEPASFTSADFVPSSDMAHIVDEPMEKGVQLTGGKKISGPNPQIPDRLKQSHLSGMVILRQTIGTDGHVRSVREVYSTDADLTAAEIGAVKSYIYEPFRANGTPVVVHVNTDFNFSFDHR